MKDYRFKPCRKFSNIIFWLMAGFTCQALAADLPAEADRSFSNWESAPDTDLAQLRGGFVLPNGITIDFSLEKAIYLNGEQTFTSVFQLPNNAALFQNGSQNLAPTWVGNALNSVIQNNLDNQAIKTLTTINIDLGGLKNLNRDINANTFRDLVVPSFQ